MTTQYQGYPRSPAAARSSVLKMTPHTPSPSTKNTTSNTSPSVTVSSLDSGYESDAQNNKSSSSHSFRDFFPRRRTPSATSRSSRTSSTKRPKSERRARSSGIFESGDVVYNPLGRSVSNPLAPEDLLDGCKDPAPPQLFVTFSDPLLDQPTPAQIRERTVSTPVHPVSLGFPMPFEPPIPFAGKPRTVSLNSPTSPSTEQHGLTSLANETYRKPSVDPAHILDEPVKPVTEEHMEPLYHTPNISIEEISKGEASLDSPHESLVDSKFTIPEVPESTSQRPTHHVRSSSVPAVTDAPIAESSAQPTARRPLPLHNLGRSLSMSASRSRSEDVPLEPLVLPEFDEEMVSSRLNDLFIEATRVLSRSHSRTGSTDSAFLGALPDKTASSTPPVTPITALHDPVSKHPVADDDDTAANEDLADTLFDSAQLTRSSPVNTIIEKGLVLVDFVPSAEDSVKWGFMFFGFVGGLVVGGIISRARR